MSSERNAIEIIPGGEFDRLLKSAQEFPVLLDRDGIRYRLAPLAQDDIWSGYDVESARQALYQSAGALAGVDREQLLADIKAQREQATHDPLG